MSESVHSESLETEAEVAATPTVPKTRSRFGVFLKWMLIVFLAMQLIMRTLWEPAWGPAIKNLITMAQSQLSVICILIWWFFCSPFRRRVVMGVGLPVLAVLIGWLASIYSIDFDGDMNVKIRYRWEQSPLERLAEFRESAKMASTEKIALVEQFRPEDMPAYRGLQRDGIVVGPAIRKDWEVNPPTELWRRPIGGGYSSFVIVDPVAITMEQRGEEETVVCYELKSGNEFWVHRYPAYFDALGGPGPRSTPTIHDGAVYSLGCQGDLFRLDLKSGAVVWHINVLEQFGLPTTHWGLTSSPLIHDGHVIVNIGGLELQGVTGIEQPGNGLATYELETGNFVWKSAGLPEPDLDLKTFQTGQLAIEGIEGKTLPGYSSPMLAQLAGQQVILNFDGTGFRGNSLENGEQLWAYPFVAGDYINVAQPIVFGDDRVMISSGYGAGSVMFHVGLNNGAWTLKELWKSRQLRCKFSSAILFGGYVYGLDEGIMTCLNPETGKRMWKGRRAGLRGRYGHGQMLLTDGQIIVLTEKGDLVLIEPSPDELKVNGVVKVLSDDVKTWNPLTIAYGKAFVRNAAEFACYDLRENPEEAPPEAAPTATGADDELATLDEQGRAAVSQ